jgi:hypothetical protein
MGRILGEKGKWRKGDLETWRLELIRTTKLEATSGVWGRRQILSKVAGLRSKVFFENGLSTTKKYWSFQGGNIALRTTQLEDMTLLDFSNELSLKLYHWLVFGPFTTV